jgi:hypothetical protein
MAHHIRPPCCGTCPHWDRGYWQARMVTEKLGDVPKRVVERAGLTTPWGECYGVPPVAPHDPEHGATFPSTHEAARCPHHPALQETTTGTCHGLDLPADHT